jgi:hypothetical protein
VAGAATEQQANAVQERRANKWAQIAAVAVLAVGLILVLLPAIAHLRAVFEDPFASPRTTVRVVKTEPGGAQTVTETTSDTSRSFLEKSLAAGGLLLLRLGIVALAAFLAGAVVQRILLANFALKLGPLEVPDIKRAAAASEEALRAIEDRLGKQARATESAMAVAADAAQGVARLQRTLLPVAEMFALEEEPSDVQSEPDDEKGRS